MDSNIPTVLDINCSCKLNIQHFRLSKEEEGSDLQKSPSTKQCHWPALIYNCKFASISPKYQSSKY